MENIKAFFGFPNTDDAAKHRCREYLSNTVDYGLTLDPVPSFIEPLAEYLEVAQLSTETSQDGTETSESTIGDDPFWVKWDEYKEEALNLLTTNDGETFVCAWRRLEDGRLPHSTAPPDTQNRRRSSLARVRLA